jgi:hypothetical protein
MSGRVPAGRSLSTAAGGVGPDIIRQISTTSARCRGKIHKRSSRARPVITVASCDFLTPFGHHNNTIIMGPGGYRFGDFWRVGLGLDAVVIAIALLVIPRVWSF